MRASWYQGASGVGVDALRDQSTPQARSALGCVLSWFCAMSLLPVGPSLFRLSPYFPLAKNFSDEDEMISVLGSFTRK